MSELIIRCSFCNTKNKVASERRFKANCGKCKRSLMFSLDMAGEVAPEPTEFNFDPNATPVACPVIASCPNCQSDEVGLHRTQLGVCIRCRDCGTEGPVFSLDQEAIDFWNLSLKM